MIRRPPRSTQSRSSAASDVYKRQLYPKPDMIGAERRLRQFLIQRFGGPDHYSQTRGHPRLRARHARFKVDPAARDRWVKLMHEAMDEVQLPPSAIPALRQ